MTSLVPIKASGCSQGEETSGPNRIQAPSQAHQGDAHGASGQHGREVSEGGGGNLLRQSIFCTSCTSVLLQNQNIYIYILYIYIYMLVAGLQGWNHVSPDRPLTGLSCEVETAGPGCPGASRGAGSGPAEHCFPSRPAGQRATHSEGRVCTLASTGNTTSGESKPNSK